MSRYDDAVSAADLDGGEYVPPRVVCDYCGDELDAADEPTGICPHCRREKAEYEMNGADPRR